MKWGRGMEFVESLFEPVAKTVEEWVARAYDSEGKDPFQRVVHVQGGVAYATNRRRMHWGATTFPNGVYGPDFYAVEYDASTPDFPSKVPDWKEFQPCALDTIEDAGIGPNGEALVSIQNGPRIIKSWLLEAMNGHLSHVWIGEDRVAGASQFGHFMIAPVRDV